MKKLTALIMSVLFLLCLSACDTSKVNKPSENTNTSSLIYDKTQADLQTNQSKLSDKDSSLTHIHKFSTANCVSPEKCSCGLTKGKALGHDCTEATCTLPKKCKRCGITKGAALGHDYRFATCTSPKKCNRCGLVEGKALGHIRTIGKCERCSVFFDVKIKLPSTPIVVEHSSYGQVRINKIEHELDEKGVLTITFSGEKVSGAESKTAFNYKLLDSEGFSVNAGKWNEEGYNIGDKFENKEIAFRLHGTCREYVLVISG